MDAVDSSEDTSYLRPIVTVIDAWTSVLPWTIIFAKYLLILLFCCDVPSLICSELTITSDIVESRNSCGSS